MVFCVYVCVLQKSYWISELELSIFEEILPIVS